MASLEQVLLRSIWLFVGIVLTLYPQEARVSQIHFKDVKLAELPGMASVIVEARYRSERKETEGGGMAFDVRVVHKSDSSGPSKGDSIHVWQKSAQAWGRVRAEAERSEMRISPIVPSYPEGEKSLVAERDYVLFLEVGVQEHEYVLVAQNAIVTPKKYKSRSRAKKSGP